MFIHNAGPQALVEYTQLGSSILAKNKLEQATFVLNGRRYSFEVQFSRLPELVIHKMNNYSRDFLLYPMESGNVRLHHTPSPSAVLSDVPHPLAASSVPEITPLCTSPYLAHKPDRSMGLSSYDLMDSTSSTPSNDANKQPHYSDNSNRDDTSRPGPHQGPFDSDDSNSSYSSHSSHSWRDGPDPNFWIQPTPNPDNLYVRKYVFDGFMRRLPFPIIIEFLFGIEIFQADYDPVFFNFSLTVIGRSTWSDAMLVQYLDSHPIDRRVIKLREVSPPFIYRYNFP